MIEISNLRKYTTCEDLTRLEADISALKEDTGFMPATSFEEGIEETLRWVTSTHKGTRHV